MGMTLEEIRDELRAHCGVDSTDIDDSSCNIIINRAYWELLNKYPFREAEFTAFFVTVAGQALYSTPTDLMALRLLSIEDPDDQQHTPLVRMTQFDYEQQYQNNASMQAAPTNYLREDGSIRLYPTPDQVYTLTLKYNKILSDLSADAGVPPIPQEWHEILLFGAVVRLYLRLADYERANAAKQHQAALIDSTVPVEAKEETDSHIVGLDVRRYDNYMNSGNLGGPDWHNPRGF
jgi:hypothetical protein